MKQMTAALISEIARLVTGSKATALGLVAMALVVAGAGAASRPPDQQASASDDLFREVLRSTDRLRGLGAEPARYRLQILFSEVVEGEDGRATLRRHAYRPGAEYWYPASTVKLCAAVSALEMIEGSGEDHEARVGVDTPLVYHPLFEGEKIVGSEKGEITLRRDIRRALIVSDNEAFNRLYEFCGRDGLDARLRAAGLSDFRVVHRLAERRTWQENGMSPRIDLRAPGGQAASLAEKKSTRAIDRSMVEDLPGPSHQPLGRAHLAGGDRVPAPMAMGHRNYISLRDLQNLTVMAARPDIDLGLPGLSLSDGHQRVLLDAMTEDPSESEDPRFDPARYDDDLPHFFRAGLERVAPRSELFIANKIGFAYGFSSETAYVEHTPSGRAFFLAMTLYTNDNATLNDNVYEYPLAKAAMADVAETLARRVLGVGAGTTRAPAPFEHRRITVMDGPAVRVKAGDAWTAPPVDAAGATEVIASWNATAPHDGGVRFEIRAHPMEGDGWTRWLSIGEAGPRPPSSAWIAADGSVRIEIDTLVSEEALSKVQLRAVASGNAGGAVLLHRLDLTSTRRLKDVPLAPDERFKGRIEAPTPFRANDIGDPSLRSRLCSPLSVRMLLSQRGVDVPIDRVASMAYDERFDIYGNWPNAIQAAWQAGVEGYLTRFRDWAQVRDHLARTGPIAISVTFKHGEVGGAPYDASDGHLIVLYGLDDQGDALVLDPALGEQGPRRVYDRDELSEAWLRRAKGLAYALLPREGAAEP